MKPSQLQKARWHAKIIGFGFPCFAIIIAMLTLLELGLEQGLKSDAFGFSVLFGVGSLLISRVGLFVLDFLESEN